LVTEFPNVYCDFGYFDKLLGPNAFVHFRKRLGTAIENAPERFPCRVCYGTDWHLMSIQKHASEYPTRFKDAIIEHPAIGPHMDKILATNALRFLDLRAFLTRSGGALTPKQRDATERLAAIAAESCE
jgi:predicted TIM-barrel fold metal-dependent hydrolase